MNYQPGTGQHRDGQVPPWGQQEYPPQAQQWGQPGYGGYPGPGYGAPLAPPYAPPPPRRSWIRRHKFLTALLAVIAVLIVAVVLSSIGSGGSGAPSTTGLAGCSSHHAVSARQWLQIAKDPDAARGQCITVYGEVTQFDADTGPSEFRADAGGVRQEPAYGYVSYPTNTLFGGDAKMLGSLVEGDLFTAEVTVAGAQSYDTQIGGSTTAPALRVDSVKRTGHLSS
ncbi:MAG TPA: hypothetical protein VNH17_12710 [Streptosporangiaceae bacterium]|nr:hypothetical protein [Streptosporangiaceae bacterium]